MDIVVNNSYIKAKVVHGVMVKYTPIVKKTKKGKWPWSPTEDEKTDSWTLEIDYVRDDGIHMLFYVKSADHSQLSTLFEKVMNQIRNQDSQFADRALEDAIINGGTK